MDTILCWKIKMRGPPGVDPGAVIIFALHQRPTTMPPKNYAGSVC